MHSTAQTNAIASGRLLTNDRTVFITVAPPKEPAATWTVDHDVVGGQHAFLKAGAPLDEARVDASSLAILLTVTLHPTDATKSLCSMSTLLVMLPTAAGSTVAIVVPAGGGWPPQSIGDVKISDTLTLAQPFVAANNGTLHVSGHLVIAGLSSATLVDFILNTKSSTATLMGGPVEFDIPADGNGVADPYQVAINQVTCVYTASLRCNYGDQLSLTVPKGITLQSGAKTISLSLDPSGAFKSTNPVQIVFNGNIITVNTLTVDVAKRSVSGSGTLNIPGQGDLSVTDLGFKAVTPTTFVPTGVVAFDDEHTITFNSILSVTGLKGKIALSDSGQSVSASGSVTVHIGSNTLAASITGLSVTTTGNVFRELGAGQQGNWSVDFSTAKVVIDPSKSVVLNHALAPCDPTKLPSYDEDAPREMQLCVGVHLGTGTLRNSDDIAYGFVSFLKSDPDRFKFKKFTLSLPESMTARVRFGAGALHVSALSLDTETNKYGGFDSDIAQKRLDTLNCVQIPIVGSVTIDQVSVGSTNTSVDATPRLGIGDNCLVFALHGFLPLQLSPQSSLTVTTLAFVHSRTLPQDPGTAGAQDVDYLNFSGAFTSGNITIVFNSLGFRTFAANDPDHPPANVVYCDRKDDREYQISHTRLCAIVDVNTPLTLAATGAQNATAIETAIGKGVSAIAGFFFGKIKL